MLRKIVNINEEKCNGCGSCAAACHEGAIVMIDGKARLIKEDYCDGLGDCLPVCPTGAISFEEREAPAYNEAAVLASKQKKAAIALSYGCPGTQSRVIKQTHIVPQSTSFPMESCLNQWPVQIKLAPVNAHYFENCNLLISADCCAYAYANFHSEFMRNHITLIGCPKLDNADYCEKLTQIIVRNNIKSVTVVRMEVPCCGGIELAVKQALKQSEKFIPWRVVTISTEGKILE